MGLPIYKYLESILYINGGLKIAGFRFGEDSKPLPESTIFLEFKLA